MFEGTGRMGETGVYYQGYRLERDDLNISFWSNSVYYPNGFSNAYSPYWIRYDVSWVNPSTGVPQRMGSLNRRAEELRTGLFKANFIIADDWPTGSYRLRWKYRVSAVSDVQIVERIFTVACAGIYEGRLDIIATYHSLSGTITVTDPWRDLAASLTIVP